MFIVVYVICVLCAIIPLYGIFALPEKAKERSEFQVDKSSMKSQKELLTKFSSLVVTLDSLLKAANLESRYDLAKLEMRTLTEDLKKTENPYFPVFSQVTDLYDKIKVYCETSKKSEELNKENAKLTKDLDEKKKDFDDLKEKMEKLEDQLRDSKK